MRTLAVLCLTAAVVALAWGRTLLRPVPPPGAPNVILISVDALRPDHLGVHGYGRDLSPEIDRLAREGTRFTNAISQGTWTLPSVPSLFLSQYVSAHGIEWADGRIPDDADDLQHLADLYDNGVAYTDDHLGELFSWLRERSLDRHTVVILTADHGEAFQEHGRMLGYRGIPYEELIRVPLIVRGPGIAVGHVVEAPVEQIDVAPTVLDLCGIERGPAMQGRSLRRVLAGAAMPERFVFSELLPARSIAIRDTAWKLIADGKTGAHELFDLRAGPTEQRNLAAARPDVVKQLLSEVATFSAANAAVRRGEPPATAEIGDATREQLRALGYEAE